MKPLKLIILLYVFLVAIGLMGTAFKTMGKAQSQGLLHGIESPFAALAVGILATVIVQSSSTTTSMVVAAVGAQQLPLEIAVFTIMGCNIGTTVTNTLVSLAHIRQAREFERAFAGATMHDFFNVIAVAIFLPLEWTTGWLHEAAAWLSAHLRDPNAGEGHFANPIKVAVDWVTKPVKELLTHDLELSKTLAGVIMLLISLGLVSFALVAITRTMRSLIANRIEQALNRVLERSGLLAIVIGAALTVAVQSSSITTSLMIPLFAAGILKLENGFPVTLGANIGTTVTAILASLASSADGLTIALVHLLFNLGATALVFPVPAIRHVPVRLAVGLARLTLRSRLWAVGYVFGVFVAIPLGGWLLFR
ncbi:MAG: Na/Pi symporter [Planctomycetota bacterium]